MNLKNITIEVCKIAKDAGAFIRAEQTKVKTNDVVTKGLNNFVTYVDQQAEKLITQKLEKLLPEAGFIVEENTISKKGEKYNWVIDPLDGTTNFLHSLPCFCVSIALTENDKPIVGVIYEINFDECFYAWKDGGAFLNDAAISVSKAPMLKNSLVATGFPYTTFEKQNEYMALFAELMKCTHGLRRIGSAAADLAYVACGRFESFYEYGLNPWDVAAGVLIVEEAGGRVSDFKGLENAVFGKEILATNKLTHSEFLKLIQNHF